MRLAYEAYDIRGRVVRDTIDAASAEEAADLLRRRGLFVTSVGNEVSASHSAGSRTTANFMGRTRGGRGGSLREIGAFTRQLSIMLGTGTPLVEALGAVERQTSEGAWRQVVSDLRTRVEEGSPLSAAMEAHPRQFDAICRSLVAAGESSGQLKSMLDRLAAMIRRQVKARSTLLGSMTYPCVLMVISVAVIGLMIGFVMPRFTGLFESLGVPVPGSTQFLLDVSSILQGYWWAGLILLFGGAISIWMYIKTPTGRIALDTFLVKAPGVGRIVRGFAAARVARMLGVLLESRVPMLEALGLTQAAAGNALYANAVAQAEELVTRGESISLALRNSNLFTPTFVEAVQTGERAGRVGPVLVNLADVLDEDNEVIIRSITSIIEPAILVVLGAIVGFVALSMFLPLLDLTALTQGAP